MINRAAIVVALASLCVQAQSPAVIVNRDTAKWVHEKRDPPGAESVVLREDAKTGGLELLVTYPAGHMFTPHSHESNERIILLEGRLSLRTGDAPEQILHPGGYAFLPAKEPQRLACTSDTRCVFYVAWDGSPRSRRPEK
jgi:quercetin dioxygenase-like cupin family protein